MLKVKNHILIFGMMAILYLSACHNVPLDYQTFKKIDAHVHLDTSNPEFMESATENGFKVITITTFAPGILSSIEDQLIFAQIQSRNFPGKVYYSTTFSLDGWQDPDWQEKTIQKLKNDFDNGAIAVKVWKNIGMTYQYPDGKFLMVDDPVFDPIFEFIESEGKPVYAHIGEPKNCWLPLDSMTLSNDRNYFTAHPEFHMYMHPEFPSHKALMKARDNLLAKHPDLKMIGCHLGSLEWDVDVLAKTLDQYPNFTVDMSARIVHLQLQDRAKVRQFMIKYSDRLLYGTDIEANNDSKNVQERLKRTWKNDWQYFTTADTMTSLSFEQSFQGLELPRFVLVNIYYKNANKWVCGY